MARNGGKRRSRMGKRYHAPGTSPGTLRAPDTPVSGPTRITVIDYGLNRCEEEVIENVEDLARYRKTSTVTWINVEGLHDIPLIEAIGRIFNIHRLTLEDIVNCGQRPKLEDYGSYHFLVMRSMVYRECLETEQISFVLAENYVLTFQEVPGDSFEAVRQRIRKEGAQIRTMGPDYLAYALIDALVDEFFPVLEMYGERIETLEDEVVLRPSPQVLRDVHQIKRDLLVLRRAAWPERDLISAFQREESHLIRPETRVFLRDCYDHTVQVIDMIETYRDLASGLQEVYLSSVSNRLNEVMKVLTIISTFFIPLNFIAGVYGMNFRPEASPLNMPELNWYFGYPFALGLMAALALSLVFYFKKKGWF